MVPALDIDRFLKRNEEKELLRLSTAGSVDDGKSTLIGRLLFDSKGVYEDQIASVRKATTQETAGRIDFALLTDGLRAEREQGITIDVAYRYFSTPRRKFIIADTPGHEQYTRNMATGASTANLAIILLDARKGVLAQSRRHAFIASLLGIPHMVVAVNKMDLVGYGEQVFEDIRAEFTAFAAQLQVTDLQFIPISARDGDNVVEKSARMAWFEGPSLLHHLETVHIASDRNLKDMRFPVQYVIRPNLNFRGFAGQVASGIVKKGDAVTVLPSGATTRVKSIVTQDGEMPMAFPPMSVTLCLEDEVDVGRGDMIVHAQHRPHVSRRVDAQMVWMSERPLERNREYLIKHTTQKVRARVAEVRYKIDVNSLQKQASDHLRLNEIGAVVVETLKPLFVDPYRRNRMTGSFILIDAIGNETVAAGMVTGRELREADAGAILEGLEYSSARITLADREKRYGHKAVAIWLVGSAEAAYVLERALFDRGCHVHVLADPRHLEVLSELARISNAAGMITICAVTADDAAERERARKIVGADRFLDLDTATLGGSAEEAAAGALRVLEEKGVV